MSSRYELLGGYDNHLLITRYETARLFHIIKCDFRIYIFIIERSDSDGR